MEPQLHQLASAQLASTAGISAASNTKSFGPIRLTIVCAVLLSVAIAISASLFLLILRNRTVAENEKNLSNIALIVAKQIEQAFTKVGRVQQGVVGQVASFGTFDAAYLEHQLLRNEFHLKLRDAVATMPYVSSLTVINAQGRIINLSRQGPIPDIDVSGSDFFMAFQSDPNLTSFIGEPIRIRPTEAMVLPLVRKISGPHQEFLGLISAAIDLQSIQNNFSEITIDSDNAMAVYRRDGVLLARFPRLDSDIGRRFPDATGLMLVSTADHGIGVSKGRIDGQSRIIAAHRVGAFPVVVTSTRAMAAVIAGWRRTAAYVIGISALSIVIIAAFAFLFIRLFRNYQVLMKARADQEKAEQLYEQGLRFDVAVNNISQGLVMFDASGRIVVCNDRYLRMYGLSPDVIKLGLTLFELIKYRAKSGLLKDDPYEYCSRILDHIVEREITSELMETTDGRAIHIVTHPMADGGWVTTHEDVTDKVQADITLRKSKQSFADLFEYSPDPLILCDSRGVIKLANNAAYKAFGYDPGELIGQPVELLVPKSARMEHVRLRERYSQGPERRPIAARRVDIKGLRKDGSEFPVEISIGPIDAAGEKMICATVRDVTDRRQADERIFYLAHNDPLTDLPNRAAFVEHFHVVIDKASKTGNQFAILCIDLDRFKEVNDTYGHIIGDALLHKVARRMEAVAEGAFLARIGGDEFVIIVADGPQSVAAEALGNRMLAAFADDFEVDGHRLELGLSIGGAVYPTDGIDAKTLMINGDIALYHVKAEKRGAIRFFDAEMGERLHERRNLQHDLRSAVDRGELVLHYQPQKTIVGETDGFEALVRWQCPKRGMVLPETFIPIAEEDDLILTVGEWVLREACREAASWSQPLTIAVNISPIQFRDGNLPSLVHSILFETGLAPARLELEITEGVLIGDLPRAVSILRKLKSLGVQIALDDFGSGYCSMSYLQVFPLDKIKIDRAFVSDLEHNHHSIAIVRAIISLGHSLDVPVLAEGVETEAQHVRLVQEGCDFLQGYLLGRPLPIEDHAEMDGHPAIAKQTYLAAAG